MRKSRNQPNNDEPNKKEYANAQTFFFSRNRKRGNVEEDERKEARSEKGRMRPSSTERKAKGQLRNDVRTV